jgi:hypothetical protein
MIAMYAVLVTLSGLVCASSSPPIKLTSKNIVDQPHLLCIGTEKNGDEMRFTVLVRLKGGQRKPLVDGAYLHINNGKAFVARCGVPSAAHPDTERNIVLYTFAVSPKYLETSTFSFSVATLDEQALKAAPAGVGWRSYEFTLRDFPVPGAPEFGVYPRAGK